ncbi:MAG: Asp-tRNA(Asn)/Glu-tRNA(Gln) amidotransferase subunit GatA [bacterium]
MNLHELTIAEANDKLEQKEISSLDLTEAVLGRIEVVNDDLNAYLKVTADEACAQAKIVDDKAARNEKSTPLGGIPHALKDNFLTKGIVTTNGSKILKDYIPPYDATVVARLKKEEAVLLGKCNQDEFAMGSSNEQSAFGAVKNPYDLERVPGGSSGGSAAAVAADAAIFALGTDTAGSIRQPASFCGVVGMKPTYGRVSRYGVMALASSLDVIGPITKTVADNALVLNYLAGQDRQDSTTYPEPVQDYTSALRPDVKGIKIGIPKEYFAEGVDAKVKSTIKEAIKKLEELGAKTEEVSLPTSKYAVPCYYIICPAEASSNLARYDGIRYGHSTKEANELYEVYTKSRSEGFGDEPKRRIIIGTYALSAGYFDAYYGKAQKVRAKIKQEFEEVFKKVDVLVAPTTPTTAFKLGEKVTDPLSLYLADILTVPQNLAGVPALSVPAGYIDGLPIGMQIMGPQFSESRLYQVGFAYEQATNWRKQKQLKV